MKRVLLLFFLLQSFLSFTQEEKAENNYVDYFKLPRESIFFHTNKTSYIAGEEIWFKVYAYDRRNNLSSKSTRNIYLGIYDDTGKQVDKKLFLAQEGVASGSISIDSTYASGKYYLKTYTNWMKNFKEDDSYVQQIQIMNVDSGGNKSKEEIASTYDIQFLPEGGYLLNGVNNNVGVKIINDSGKGVSSEGIILNSKGVEVASFKSNFLGLGKFSFTPVLGEIYTSKIKLGNERELEQKIPKAEDIGMSIIINNLKSNQVIINLSLNQKSLDVLQGKNYKVLVHKDGQAKIIPFGIDNLVERITIDKAGLFKGINTVTVFNEKEQPILERMFFNDAELKYNTVSLNIKESKLDSITYQIASNVEQDQMINASISVLPTQTKSYTPQHNIISAFYLKPYLKGAIENPQYYFTKINRKKKYELDILLLTQGWSRYSWDNIMNLPPEPHFDFENGITLKGKLDFNIKKAESLLLYPTLLNKSKFIHFDADGKFRIKNFLPVVGETLKFSYVDKRGNAKDPKMALSYVKYLTNDKIDTTKASKFSLDSSEDYYIPKYFFDKESELLDEVVVSTQLQKKKRKEYNLPYRGELIPITRRQVERFNNLSDFLNTQGFIVTQSFGRYSIKSFRKQSKDQVIMFLDNNIVNDVSTVLSRSIAFYEDVFIDENSVANNLGISSDGFGFKFIIKLYSRKNSLFTSNRSKEYQKFIKVNYGFQVEKEFYMPRYFSYTTQSFKDNGIIHWEPNLTIKNQISSLKTVNTGLEEVNFYIEGINSNGDLISQIIKVDHSVK